MSRGLYLHIPFCKSKCRYCSFNSFSGISFLQKEYTRAMVQGIKKLNNDQLSSVYIGGGTPSFIDGEHIVEIMNAVYDTFDVCNDAEITIEINPKTVDENKLSLYKSVGINRVSMGVQSMNDNELCTIGRAHNSEDAKNSVNMLRKCGFNNISLDLMYALPNQTEKTLKETLKKMTQLNPEHISCYGLSIDEGTPMWDDMNKGRFTQKTDDEYLNMYNIIREILANEGYSHYEISNFAKCGYEAKHNSSYWKCKEYYAMGAGASGYINSERFVYTEDIEEFIGNPHLYTVEETLTKEDKMSEFVILGLRMLKDGVNKKEFERRFGCDVYQIYDNEIKKHISSGMIEDKGDRIILTSDACYVCNNIMADFII